MLRNNNISFRLAAAIISSVLFGISFEGILTSFGVIASLSLLIVSCQTLSLKHACYYGAICGAATWLFVLRWILADGNGLTATVLWVGLSVVGSLHWLLFATVVSLFRNHVCRFIMLPILWAFLEEARNWVMIGCPWYYLSYPLATWQSGIQVASILGASGLSGLMVLVNLCLAEVFLAANIRDWKRTVKSLSAAITLLLTLHLYGCWIIGHEKSVGREILVGVMQTNFVLERTADWEATDMCHEWASLASELKSHQPDIIIAPESCFPNPSAWVDYFNYYNESVPDEWEISATQENSLCSTSDQCSKVIAGIPVLRGQPFIFGATIRNEPGTRLKGNSLLFTDPNGHVRDLYLKQACLPFYEQRYWGILDDDTQSVQPADATQAILRTIEMKDGATTHVAPLICYEDSLPGIYEYYSNQARLIGEPILFVVSGNEALCRSSRRTHLQLVQMRAVEFGVPIVRAVNSGDSSHIDAFGRIHMCLGESSANCDDNGKTGIARMSPQLPNTFYSRYRRHLLVLYAGVIFLLLFREAILRFSIKRKVL